ncbi:hypothetical protein PCK1_001480 [Pneumocystis canis]|nr:hypothetical protein PCK1_001480 [Pneumocystis canis]
MDIALLMMSFFRFSKNYKQYNKKKLSRDNKYSEKSLSGIKKVIDGSKEWLKSPRSLNIYHKSWKPRSYLHSSQFLGKNDKDLDINWIYRTETVESLGPNLSENTYLSLHIAKVDGFKIFKSRPHVYLKNEIVAAKKVFPIDTNSKRSSHNSCISSLADEMNNTEIRILLERDQRRRKRNRIDEKIQSEDTEKEHDLIIETLLDRKLSNNAILFNQPLNEEFQNYNLKSSKRDSVELSLKYKSDVSVLQNINNSQIYNSENINYNSTSINIISNNDYNSSKDKQSLLFSKGQTDNANSKIKDKLNNQQKDLSFVSKDLLPCIEDQNTRENLSSFKHSDLLLFNHFVQNNTENNDYIFRSSLSSFSQSHRSQQEIPSMQLPYYSKMRREEDSENKDSIQITNINTKIDNMENCNLPTVSDPPFSMILSPPKLNSSNLQLLTLKNGLFNLDNLESSKNVYSFVTDNFLELFEFFHGSNFYSSLYT